jgi:hypothetical protein
MRDETKTKELSVSFSSFRFHPSSFPKRRVSPGEYGRAFSNGGPGTNGATFKNSLRSVE